MTRPVPGELYADTTNQRVLVLDVEAGMLAGEWLATSVPMHLDVRTFTRGFRLVVPRLTPYLGKGTQR